VLNRLNFLNLRLLFCTLICIQVVDMDHIINAKSWLLDLKLRNFEIKEVTSILVRFAE
jgi:hypothetical protein